MTEGSISRSRLILASRSPRRARLLAEAGVVFVQLSPEFSDPLSPVTEGGETAAGLAERLALAKGRSLCAVHPGDDWILASDTLCVGAGGEVLGTPVGVEEARAMLRGFMNCDHQVITGVALLGPGGEVNQVFSDAAVVTWGEVGDEVIEAYLGTDAWRDKAGGYNLFDRQEAGWPVEVVGDPATVVGLPMRRLLPVLAELGFVGGRA
ncbi:MAG: Maf family protein [Phycisphaeraceae bacterium]